MEIEEDELKSLDPNFWDDPKSAELLLKKIKQKKYWTKSYESVNGALEDLAVLLEFHKEGEATEEEIDSVYEELIVVVEELEFKNMLSAEEDNLGAVLQITAGAGGTESCDWGAMLLRM
ncbi:MAG: peptide chain release factor 2, partial [Parvicellaceae bacterium]